MTVTERRSTDVDKVHGHKVYRKRGVTTVLSVVVGVFGWVLAEAALAGEATDSGVVLKVFPNAQLEFKDSREAKNYPVLSNRINKIRGKIRSQGDQWLNGWLERRIYQIPPGHSSDDVFTFLRNALKEQNTEELFTCSGRDCGASNLWANDIFHVAMLYGNDREQRYLLATKKTDVREYFLIYATAGGSKRVYAMIDRFQVKDPD